MPVHNSVTPRPVQTQQSLVEHCRKIACRSRAAAGDLASASGEQRADCLRAAAAEIRRDIAAILAANARDLEAAPGFGLTEAATDRLKLDADRVAAIAAGVEAVAALPDPVGELIEASREPSSKRKERDADVRGCGFTK